MGSGSSQVGKQVYFVNKTFMYILNEFGSHFLNLSTFWGKGKNNMWNYPTKLFVRVSKFNSYRMGPLLNLDHLNISFLFFFFIHNLQNNHINHEPNIKRKIFSNH